MKTILLKSSLLAGATLIFASASPVQSQDCSNSGYGYSSGSSGSFSSFFRPIRLWFVREQPVQSYESSNCRTNYYSDGYDQNARSGYVANHNNNQAVRSGQCATSGNCASRACGKKNCKGCSKCKQSSGNKSTSSTTTGNPYYYSAPQAANPYGAGVQRRPITNRSSGSCAGST